MGYLDEGRYPDAIEVFEKAKPVTHDSAEIRGLIAKAQKAFALEKSLSASGRFRLEGVDRLLAALTAKRITTLVAERGVLCVPSQAYHKNSPPRVSTIV